MKKFKSTIGSLNLNYKKEMYKVVLIPLLILLLSALTYFIAKNFYAIIIGIIFSFIFTYLKISSYNQIKETNDRKNYNDFVVSLSFLKIYIDNNVNVYTSFIKLKDVTSGFVKEKIDSLCREMDEDKTVRPFVNFAKSFNSLFINQLMISIFQLIDHGNESNYLTEFNTLYKKISDEQHEKEMSLKLKKLDLANLTPLVGSAIITVIITIGIINVIGGVVSGI